MKNIFKLIIASVAAASLFACTDNSGLEERVNELEGRVTAIENVLDALNDNVEVLQAIAEGKTINSVTEKDGVYTITLSNGEELTLTQGSVGMGKAPLLSIDKDGWWMVDYQDGKGPQYVTSEGEKVLGRGSDGVTPKFSVSKDGYWTVSYDGGKTWADVLDENGSRVLAVAESGGEDSYFADVTYTDEALILTLKNGQSYTAPVVGGFLFKINGVPDGDVTFKGGEKKTFGIEQKGVVYTTVMRPEGWNAWLTESILTVQAPAAASADTKAVIADSRKDVSVIAVSEAGHVAVAKVRVYVDGQSTVDDPAAGIRLLEAAPTTLKFSIILENASSWKYMLLPSSDPAPSRAEVIASGTDGGAETQIMFDKLNAETSYTLYVVPGNASGDGPLASCEASTTAFSNLYEAWQAGMDVKIDGVAYNKSAYGEATLIESDGPIAGNGVYFIADGVTATLPSSDTFKGSLIVCGNTATKRSASVVFSGGALFRLGDESAEKHVVAFRNVNLGIKNTTLHFVNTAIEGLGSFVIDGCYINLEEDILWRQKTVQTLRNFTIVNCDILVANDKDGRGRAIIQTWNGSQFIGAGYKMGTFTARNNVVWSKAEEQIPFYFIDCKNGDGLPWESVTMENNTFYNVGGAKDDWFSRALLSVNTVSGDIIVRNNLFYQSKPVNKGTNGERLGAFVAVRGENINPEGKVQTGGNWSWYPQTCFLTTKDKKYWYGNQDNSFTGGKFSTGCDLGVKMNGNTVESMDEPFESADVETGTFVKKAVFADKGASR